MQLAHDHAFGAINNERSRLGHERQLANIDFLFLGDPLANETKFHFQRRGIGHSALLTFRDRILGFAESVSLVFKPAGPVETFDGKTIRERRFQPLALAPAIRAAALQKFLIRLDLDLYQVR